MNYKHDKNNELHFLFINNAKIFKKTMGLYELNHSDFKNFFEGRLITSLYLECPPFGTFVFDYENFL